VIFITTIEITIIKITALEITPISRGVIQKYHGS